MARINICGFETGDASELYSWAGGTDLTIQSTTKRTGSYAAKWKPNGAASLENFTVRGLAADGTGAKFSDPATIYIRFYLYIAAAASGDMNLVMFFKRTGGNALKGLLSLTSARKLKFLDAGSTTTTGTTVLSTGQWYRIEAKVGTGASNASWEVKIDGTSEISSLTANLTANGCSECIFGYYNTAPTDGEIYWDDIAIDDAAYPGAGQVNILTPNGAGNLGEWTGSYTDVDEVPHDSDTTYLAASGSVGLIHYIALTSAATGGVSGTISAVKAIGVVRDEGGASTIYLRMYYSASELITSGGDPGATYTCWGKLSETAPGGGAWTTGILDALELGVTSNTTAAVRCTALYAMVECSGSTNYTQSVTGISGTITGTLVKQTLKSLSGISGTLSGILTRSTLKVLSGINGTLSGILNNNTLKALSGAISTLTGILTSIRVTFVSVVGIMGTLSGTLTNNTLKSLSGATGSLAASLVRVTQKALSGVSGSLSGGIQKTVYLTLNGLSGLVSGSLAAAHIFAQLLSGALGIVSGVISRTTQKSLSGQINSIVGTLAKLVSKVLSGTSGSMSGALSRQLVKIVNLVGVVGTVSATLTRSTIKTVSGTLNQIVGSLSRGFLKNVSLSGVLNSFSGDVGLYGIVKRAKMKAGEVTTTTVKAGALATGTVMKAGSVLVTRIRSGWRNK